MLTTPVTLGPDDFHCIPLATSASFVEPDTMTSASTATRILCYSRSPEHAREFAEQLHDQFEVICPDSLEDSLETLQDGGFSGLFLCGQEMSSAGLLLQAGGILDHLHDGFALVGHRREIAPRP